MLKKGIFFSVCLLGAYSSWSGDKTIVVDTDIPSAFPVSYVSQLSVDEKPYQKKINYKKNAFQYADYIITPLAEFQVAARILSSKHYNRGKESELSPVDLALGWGPMSRPEVIEKFSIRQSNRFYFWKTDNFPIPRQDVIANSANMHFIPTTLDIENKLKDLKTGQKVRLKGYLVRIDQDSGWYWMSSLSRSDSGNGACEIVLVDDISII